MGANPVNVDNTVPAGFVDPRLPYDFTAGDGRYSVGIALLLVRPHEALFIMEISTLGFRFADSHRIAGDYWILVSLIRYVN